MRFTFFITVLRFSGQQITTDSLIRIYIRIVVRRSQIAKLVSNKSIKMQFFVISLTSVFMIGFTTSFTIILTGDDDDFSGFTHDNEISVEKLVTHNKRYNVLESMYTSQDVGKSHRFYFTAGERQDGL